MPIVDNEKGYAGSSDEGHDAPKVCQQPTGLKVCITTPSPRSVNNMLGVTLLIGSMGYSLYIGSYLAINIHSNAGDFVVAVGAILGNGSLMMAYPTKTQKGKFIRRFRSISNLAGVVRASVAGRNWKSTANTVDNGLFVTLKIDLMIILLFPLFFASNWFYTWQFSNFNGVIFNICVRGLNNVCYWFSQIIGSILMGLLLNQKSISHCICAYTGWTVLSLIVFIIHIWGSTRSSTHTRVLHQKRKKHKKWIFTIMDTPVECGFIALLVKGRMRTELLRSPQRRITQCAGVGTNYYHVFVDALAAKWQQKRLIVLEQILTVA
ncbi:hypothetical protein EDD85DRAFT_783256 [Armillaria nabsnona]|nr:hypothetical protein EDD85DRAFT_783256 [Armillaria nabsnona]